MIYARADLFVIVGSDASESIQRAVDEVIRSGGHLDDVLVALTSEGLAVAPAFAAAGTAAGTDADTRILVRGEVRLDLEWLDGSRSEVTCGRSSTWKDDVLSGVRRIVVTAPDGAEINWLHPAGGAERSRGEARAAAPSRPTPATSAVGLGDRGTGGTGSRPIYPRTDEEASPIASDRPHATAGERSNRDEAAGPAERAHARKRPPVTTDEGGSSADDHDEPDVDPYLSNLLDHTVFHDVESAAVRSAPDGEADGVAETAPGSGAPGDATGQLPNRATAGGANEGDLTLPEPPESSAVSAPLGSTPIEPTLEPRSASKGVITSVPGLHVPLASADGRRRSETTTRSVPRRPPGSEPMIGDGLGDKDGRTVALSHAVATTRAGGLPAKDQVGTPSRRCLEGHLNPPTSVRCRSCGRDISAAELTDALMPVVARLRFETGWIVDVDRTQVIGRQPTAEPFERNRQIPNLLTLPSPDGHLSRVHLVINLEGWDILVEDLGSTNGTEVRLPDQEPERLREFSPKLVVPGAVVTLGGATSFRIELPE